MPHFAEIQLTDRAIDYLDLEKVYRVTVSEDPSGVAERQVEVYFVGREASLTLTAAQAEDFLAKFQKWMGSHTLP